MRILQGKRAQNFEMVMVFAGIVLLIVAFTSVIATRNHIPNEPNLAAKTILLTEKTFDILEFYFETSVADVSQTTHVLSDEGLAKCLKISSADVTNPINGYYLVTSSCVNPALVQTYLTRFSTELDARLSTIDARGSYLDDFVHPKSFLTGKGVSSFEPGQFMVTLTKKTPDDVSVNVVSRIPLKIDAFAMTKNKDSKQWLFAAQRDLLTSVQLSKQDKDVLRLMSNIAIIREVAWQQIEPTVNDKNAKGEEVTFEDKSKFVDDITAKLNGLAALPILTPISQLSANDYFAYVVVLHEDSIYVLFPNAKMAIFVHTFTV